MRQRPLGTTGLIVSEIGFGGWQLGSSADWGPMDAATAHRLVHEALDLGITLFDTAPNYGGWNGERLLGEALSGRRHEVVLVSKFGHLPGGPKEFSVSWFRKSLDESLRRLRTDYIDALLLHNPPRELYEGTDPLWDAMEEARTAGKIRHYGASLDLAAEVDACLANTRSDVVEVLFNVFHQDVRRSFPRVNGRGAGVLVKVPLDSGWLAGRYDARSRFDGIRGRWTPETIERRAELVNRLEWLTADGAPLAVKALRFALSYDEVSCVLPGARTGDQLRANAAAAGDRLSPEDRARLERFWDELTESGARLLPW